MSKKTKKLPAEEKEQRAKIKRKKKIIKAIIVCSIIAIVIACTAVSAVLVTRHIDRENQLYDYEWIPVSAQNASKDEVNVRQIYGDDVKYTNYQGNLKFSKGGTFDLWMSPGLPDDGTHTGKFELDGDTVKASFDDGTQTEFYIERENGYIKTIKLGYNEYTVYFGQGEKIIEENITETN